MRKDNLNYDKGGKEHSWKFISGLVCGLTLFLIAATQYNHVYTVYDNVNRFVQGIQTHCLYNASGTNQILQTEIATQNYVGTQISATDAGNVKTTGDQTVAGEKTFSTTIVGSVSGNSGTVTNGLYSTGSYFDPSWLTLTSAKVGLSSVLNALQLYKNGADFAGLVQGSVFYYNGTQWDFLPPGDSGKFLKTSGAAANPLWDTPAGTTTFAGLTDTFAYAGLGGQYVKVKAAADGLETGTPMALSIPAAAGNLAKLNIAGQVYDGGTLENAISAKANLAIPSAAGNIAKLNIQGQIYDGGALAGGGDMLSTDYDTAGSSSVRMARGLKESGATELTMGAVADGQYLKRSGTTIISATPAGGGDMMVAPPSAAGNIAKLNIAGQVYDGEAASEAANPSTFVLRDINAAITAEAFYGDGSHLTGVSALPSQTGNNGKYLTTNGSAASWAAVSGSATATAYYTQDFTINEALDGYTISNYGATGGITGTFDAIANLGDGFAFKMINESAGQGIDAYTSLVVHANGEDNGTVFSDSSYNNNVITASGCVTKTATKKFGSASVYFDGTNDYLSTPNSSKFNLGLTATIDFWIYPLSATFDNNGQVIGKALGGSPYTGYYFLFETDGRLRFGSNPGGALLNTTALEYNQWYHVALVNNNGTCKIYLNGVCCQTETGITIGEYDTPFTVGKNTTGNYGKFYLDELRVDKGIARWVGNFDGSLPNAEYYSAFSVTLAPASGEQLPNTSAINRNLISSAKGDFIEIGATGNNLIGKSVFPSTVNWVDTAQP